ncbi:MAG: ribonuclease protein component [Oscillospiraceae bacterium]|nr:ribonuclease protein component [Oscillospiraceae bacterium]
MSKQVKLTLNCEFKRCYYRGKYKVSPLLICYVLKNRQGKIRIGITASKKVGNAVLRNRARRVISAAARDVLAEFSGGYDIVFVARKDTPQAKSYDIAKSMKKLLNQLL